MATNDSYVLTAEKNGIKVKSTIYGVITPERVANARKELSYRLEQLQPIPKLSEMWTRLKRLEKAVAELGR